MPILNHIWGWTPSPAGWMPQNHTWINRPADGVESYEAVNNAMFRNIPAGNPYGVKFELPGDVWYWGGSYGEGVYGDPHIVHYYYPPVDSDIPFPMGPITCMFLKDGQPFGADGFTFSLWYARNFSYYSGGATGAFNEWYGLGVEVLGRDGEVLYTHPHFTGPAIYDPVPEWTYGSPPEGSDLFGARYIYDGGDGSGRYDFHGPHWGPAYGFRLIHSQPGYGDPMWFGLVGGSFFTHTVQPDAVTTVEYPGISFTQEPYYTYPITTSAVGGLVFDIGAYAVKPTAAKIELVVDWTGATSPVGDPFLDALYVNGVRMNDVPVVITDSGTSGRLSFTVVADIWFDCTVELRVIVGDMQQTEWTFTVVPSECRYIIETGYTATATNPAMDVSFVSI